jgi:hypothetical protein
MENINRIEMARKALELFIEGSPSQNSKYRSLAGAEVISDNGFVEFRERSAGFSCIVRFYVHDPIELPISHDIKLLEFEANEMGEERHFFSSGNGFRVHGTVYTKMETR